MIYIYTWFIISCVYVYIYTWSIISCAYAAFVYVATYTHDLLHIHMKCYIYTRSTCTHNLSTYTHNLSTYTHNLSTYTHYQSFVSKPGMKCKLSTLESSLNRVLVISLSYSFSCSFSFSFFLILLLFRSCVLFPIWRLATCTVECAHTTLREL